MQKNFNKTIKPQMTLVLDSARKGGLQSHSTPYAWALDRNPSTLWAIKS
jgi:hypothetical protein